MSTSHKLDQDSLPDLSTLVLESQVLMNLVYSTKSFLDSDLDTLLKFSKISSDLEAVRGVIGHLRNTTSTIQQYLLKLEEEQEDFSLPRRGN